MFQGRFIHTIDIKGRLSIPADFRMALQGKSKSKSKAPTLTVQPDGQRILTASWDRTARLWPHFSDPQALIDHAGKIIARLQPLTKAERCQFYLDSDGCKAGD